MNNVPTRRGLNPAHNRKEPAMFSHLATLTFAILLTASCWSAAL